MIQFKLINKETNKKVNTVSFVNVPLAKMTDSNISIIQDVMIKINGVAPSTVGKKKEMYIPYNKSILTRIIAPYMSKSNILIMHHMTKKAIKGYLERKPSLFLFLDKVYGDRRLVMKKIGE